MHAFEAFILDEAHKLLEIVVGLAGMSHHQRGANMNARHFVAHPLNQGIRFFLGDIAPHGRIAAEYIASNLQVLGIRPLSDSYLQPFEACAKERQQKSRFQIHPDSIALIKKGVHRILLLNNVLGKIEGKNPNEFVVIGAHYDHLGIDPTLEGDCIYNGADDNASGVSAVLQVAKAFIASGIQPERTVIFAFWDGEEKGLLGSQYFCLSFPEIKKVKAYLNYDMIGRNNQESRPTQFVYFYTKSHPIFGEWLKKDIENYQLHLTPDYHPCTTNTSTN